jgi:hypothetical protein
MGLTSFLYFECYQNVVPLGVEKPHKGDILLKVKKTQAKKPRRGDILVVVVEKRKTD